MRKKTVLWITLGVLAALLVAAMAFSVHAFSLLDMDKLGALGQSTVLLDDKGRQAALLSGSVNRTVIELDNVPAHVREAFVAAEDARFYRHFGIDVYRIGGALLSNIKSGDYGQGASTITQQLIKLTHLTSDKTVTRKAQEALLAIRLETMMSKEKILETYLNTVYFGAGAYGIEAAAQTYFGIPASDLSLPQGALLAGVIKSPSNYAPHMHLENAVKRRELVLSSMVEQEYITQAQADEAARDVPEIVVQRKNSQYAWYVEQAADEAVTALGITREELLSGGYKLYTALNADMQKSAEALFENDEYFPADSGGAQAQAALVCASTVSGEVYCLIGGRDYVVERGLNRATGIKRQPGSAFKPISVYAEAVDRFGYLPTSFVDDTRRDFGGGYSPGNSGGNYYGAVTLREALSRSLNVATVDLLSKTSVQAARQYAQAAGIALSSDDDNLSMGLGALTEGVSPMELNAAYAPLANGGSAVSPHLIRKIEDVDGRVVYEFYQQEKRVMSAVSARLITDMLMTAAKSGTAKALNTLSFEVAGKTGTVGMAASSAGVSGNRDVWTVAYTPTASVAVWMGFDQPSAARKMSDSVTGSSHPARLAAAFMNKSAKAIGGAKFNLPSGLIEVLIDKRALAERHKPMLIAELTPRSEMVTELFPAVNAPTAVSDVWRAPSRVFDLKATRVEGGVQLTFTAVDDYALYQVFRVQNDEATLIAELSGAQGDALTCIDFEDQGERGYYVLPFEKTLKLEGVDLVGQPSKTVTVTRALDWNDPPEAESTPQPEKPLF